MFFPFFFVWKVWKCGSEKKIGHVIADDHTYMVKDKMVLQIFVALPYLQALPRGSYFG